MQMCYALIDEIGLLHDYYQFRTIELQIDSPGGSADAHYMVQALTAWRKGDERILRTVGLNEICSAAAMLLSLGTIGHRSAHHYSRLLYHQVRGVFQSNSVQTYAQLKTPARGWSSGITHSSTCSRNTRRCFAREPTTSSTNAGLRSCFSARNSLPLRKRARCA